jgi:hypothetical protein
MFALGEDSKALKTELKSCFRSLVNSLTI